MGFWKWRVSGGIARRLAAASTPVMPAVRIGAVPRLCPVPAAAGVSAPAV